MIIVNSIEQVPYHENLGIVINVNTKYVTTLALLSWLSHSNIPVLVIDCESTDGSLQYFSALKDKYDFYLAQLPLKLHGHTLDFLFRKVNADNLFLIDSDTELLDSRVIDFMLHYIRKDSVFGSGFIHEGCWLGPQSRISGIENGYYASRMWIPFTCLKRTRILEALERNLSFTEDIVLNDFAPSRFISKILARRHNIKFLRNSKLSFLNLFKTTIDGHKPGYIIYDTGARVYEFLKFKQGYDFVGTPASLADDYVLHFHGVTRAVLNPQDQNSQHFATYEKIIDKLRTVYNLKVG